MNTREQLKEIVTKKESSKTLDNYVRHNTLDKIFDTSTKKQKGKVVPIVLDDKVDEFIKWYSNNIVKGNYTDIFEYHTPIDLRNFIEKMAIWYELRYPSYEVNKFMHCGSQEHKDINEIMFQKNQYMNDKINESYVVVNDEKMSILEEELVLINNLKWDEFYNTYSFINSLPSEERVFLSKPRYQRQIKIGINGRKHHYLLTSDGYVRTYNDSSKISVNDKDGKTFDFIDINIEELLSFLKNGNFELYSLDVKNIEDEIQRYKNNYYANEELLNCVMYRIIERGGNRIGPRRAFLFATEFGRNIDIPMIYGVDYSDPGLRLIINEYIRLGGSKELVCYVNYFSRAKKYEKLNTVTMRELIKNQNSCYTSEEIEFHQRLVTALSSQINQDDLLEEQQTRKEEGKKLSLQKSK